TFLRSFNVHQKLVCHHYSVNLQRRLPGYQSIDNIAAHRLGWALKGVTPAPSARCYAYQPISFCNPARDFRLKGFLSSIRMNKCGVAGLCVQPSKQAPRTKGESVRTQGYSGLITLHCNFAQQAKSPPAPASAGALGD